MVESPHVFRRGDLHYLVFTGNGANPLRLATGPDPAGAAGTWTYRGTVGAMVGLYTGEWFASEYFKDGTHHYFCFVNYDRVDVREIVWGPDWQFTLKQPDLFHVQRLTWNATQAVPGQPVRLRIEAVNTLGKHVKLKAFEVDADGSEEPIPLAMIGLPDSIKVPNPTTDYWWIAAHWPDDEPGDLNAEIIVRMDDETAVSPPISVAPDPWQALPWTGQGDGTPRRPREFTESRSAPAAAGFRALQRSPLGGTALLVDLAGPARARVEIFDLSGRRVRGLAERELPAGASVLAWDGRDDSGSRVSPGVYFARLATGGFEHTVRVLATP